MSNREIWRRWACWAGVLVSAILVTAQEEWTIVKPAASFIPLHMEGFTGEVATVLKFDLEVAGFELVSESQATYLLKGGNEGNVQGRLIDRVSQKQLVGVEYGKNPLRRQAHALADAVVLAVTGKPGVAQTKIAFRVAKGENSEIYVSDYDGANAQAMTKDNTISVAPAWVPGKWMLFYTSYKSGYPDIYSQDLLTGTRKAVAQFSGLNTSAAISPDGKRVAMILSKGGSPDLYVADLEGKNLKQLTRTRQDESSPCWSPDGRTICVVSRMTGYPALYTIPAAGGELKPLRTIGARSVTEPAWSPDGRYILFTAMKREFELGIIPAAGGEAIPLVAGEDGSWAPNSRTVVFTRRTGKGRTLSLLDVPTKRVKDVPQNLGSCSQPAWAK